MSTWPIALNIEARISSDHLIVKSFFSTNVMDSVNHHPSIVVGESQFVAPIDTYATAAEHDIPSPASCTTKDSSKTPSLTEGPTAIETQVTTPIDEEKEFKDDLATRLAAKLAALAKRTEEEPPAYCRPAAAPRNNPGRCGSYQRYIQGLNEAAPIGAFPRPILVGKSLGKASAAASVIVHNYPSSASPPWTMPTEFKQSPIVPKILDSVIKVQRDVLPIVIDYAPLCFHGNREEARIRAMTSLQPKVAQTYDCSLPEVDQPEWYLTKEEFPKKQGGNKTARKKGERKKIVQPPECEWDKGLEAYQKEQLVKEAEERKRQERIKVNTRKTEEIIRARQARDAGEIIKTKHYKTSTFEASSVDSSTIDDVEERVPRLEVTSITTAVSSVVGGDTVESTVSAEELAFAIPLPSPLGSENAYLQGAIEGYSPQIAAGDVNRRIEFTTIAEYASRVIPYLWNGYPTMDAAGNAIFVGAIEDSDFDSDSDCGSVDETASTISKRATRVAFSDEVTYYIIPRNDRKHRNPQAKSRSSNPVRRTPKNVINLLLRQINAPRLYICNVPVRGQVEKCRIGWDTSEQDRVNSSKKPMYGSERGLRLFCKANGIQEESESDGSQV